MMSNAAIFLLALGAAGDVPHWVQKKQQSPFKMAVLPVLSMQSRLVQQTSNSRRLQAIMSEECNAACPGLRDFLMEMMGSRRLDGHDKEEQMDPEMAKKMCTHLDAVKCMQSQEVCQDEPVTAEDKQGTAMMECACICPKIMEAMTGGAGEEAMCTDTAGTVGCITENQPACAALAKEMPKEEEMGLMCEMKEKGCEEKFEGVGTCVGMEDMATWDSMGCDKADGITEQAEKCCPIGKKQIDCIGADCMVLTMAMDKVKGESTATMEASRKACPDAGIPSDAQVDSTASSGSLAPPPAESDQGSPADFAAPGQTFSMLAMAAATAACMIA